MRGGKRGFLFRDLFHELFENIFIVVLIILSEVILSVALVSSTPPPPLTKSIRIFFIPHKQHMLTKVSQTVIPLW